MNHHVQDEHNVLDPEQRDRVNLETRHAAQLKTMEMEDRDYDAAVDLLAFIGSKPSGIVLSGEIISLLREKPYDFSPNHIANLLKYLTKNNFICIGGTVQRRHPLGNFPIQLVSMRERRDTTIH